MLERIFRTFNRVFTRRDLEKRRGPGYKDKYRFLIFEIPFDYAKQRRKDALTRFGNHPIWKSLQIRNLKLPEDKYLFTELYNKIFLASPDPSRPITVEEAMTFPEDRVFIACLWGSPAGFIYLSLDKHPIREGLTTGIVTGIGVLPRFRARRVGVALLCKAVEYFEQFNPDTIIAEIYEENYASQQLFRSFGFRPIGETYF